MDGACDSTMANPASSEHADEDARGSESLKDNPPPTASTSCPGTLPSVLDTNECGPSQERHSSDQIMTAVGEAMEVDIADSALPGPKSNPSEADSVENEHKKHEEDEECTASFQTDVGGDASSEATDVEGGAAEASPMDKLPISDTAQSWVSETEAMLQELLCGDHSAQSDSEGLVNTGLEKTDTPAPSHSGELGSRGDEHRRAWRASDGDLPADTMPSQQARGPRPPNLFSAAPVSRRVAPFPDIDGPNLGNPGEQLMTSSARSRLSGLDLEMGQRGILCPPGLRRPLRPALTTTEAAAMFEMQNNSRNGGVHQWPRRTESNPGKKRSSSGRARSSSGGLVRSHSITIMIDEDLRPDHFNPANLDVNVLVSQLRTVGQIVDEDSGEVVAAAPDRFGITRVMDKNGIVLFDTKMRARRRREGKEAEARAEMHAMSLQAGSAIEVHVDDDLVGAAAAGSSAEKWTRLMGSSEEHGR